MRIPWVLFLPCAALCGGLCACAVRQPLPVPPGLLDFEPAVEELPGLRGWLGLEVAPNESESLEELEIRPGLRITAVAAGSPADRAGLRAGDVLLNFDSTPVNDPERLESLLAGIATPRRVLLTARRGTRDFVVDADAEVREMGGAGCTLHHVDVGRLRAAFRDTFDGGAFPEVARLADDSPLRAAGVRAGDRVVSFLGRDPGSAAELVRRVALELEPGAEGCMVVRRPDGAEEEVSFRAWEPPRVLTRLRLWPVFDWEWRREEGREVFVVGDFFLFSLFKRVRFGHEATYSLLSLISWRTGEAVLERAPAPPAATP